MEALPARTPSSLLRQAAILLLGFASGLPLALTGGTLAAWLATHGISRESIGFFGAVAAAYSFKFLWSPLVDNLPFPVLSHLLGRRRGWLLGVQALLIGAMVMLGFCDPTAGLAAMAPLAFAVAALSATQDIIIDAYRVERLLSHEQARGAAMANVGYRLAMLVSGAGALILASSYGWQFTYLCMAALLPVGAIAVLLAGEPEASGKIEAEIEQRQRFGEWLTRAVIAPFRDFTQHRGWAMILGFVLLYKFSDAFLGIMTTPFLIELGIAIQDIGKIGKLYGFVASLLGGFAGAWMAERIGLIRSLWIGGILNGLSNLAFLWLAQAGPDLSIYAAVNSIENFTGAMSGAVLVAYLSSLCNIRYTATQYALLSSLASVGRTLLSTGAGVAATAVGWPVFFEISALLALPPLVMLWLLERGTNARAPASRA